MRALLTALTAFALLSLVGPVPPAAAGLFAAHTPDLASDGPSAVLVGPSPSTAVASIYTDHVPRPVNDRPSGAIVLPTEPFTITSHNVAATLDAGEQACAPEEGATVWYKFKVPPQGMSYWVDTIGSTIDTVLGVYFESPNYPGGIQNIDCNDNNRFPDKPTLRGTESRSAGGIIGGIWMYFQVGGARGQMGQFQLNLNFEPMEADVGACFEYNPSALTNACVDTGGGGTTNVPRPVAGTQNQPVCVIGPVCVGVPTPTVGWTETPVPTPAPDGYAEATVLCSLSVPCRVEA